MLARPARRSAHYRPGLIAPRQPEDPREAPRANTRRPAIRRLAALAASVLAIAGTHSLVSAAGAASRASVTPPRSTSQHPVEAPVTTTVGLRTITFIDHTRFVRFHNGHVEPRTLVTQIRYPAVGSADADDVRDAPRLPPRGPTH